MQTPQERHWILRYVKGIVDIGINYNSGGNPLLVGFTDSYWVDDPRDYKSIAG
jgi:hypothetical protein